MKIKKKWDGKDTGDIKVGINYFQRILTVWQVKENMSKDAKTFLPKAIPISDKKIKD